MKNAALLLCYFLFVTGANIFLKLSADAHDTRILLVMLAAGNLAGFVGVLAYTGLMRTLPLHVAFPLSRGMAVLGVQLLAALVFFHESFTTREAAAVALVTAGIILVGVSAPRAPASHAQPAAPEGPTG
jgi:multidrug transporter EmrE-like cation transporter